MIRGITKPISPEAALISDDQRRTAAGLYITGLDLLFAKFDPETGGENNLPLLAPFDDEDTNITAVASREMKSLEVWAPDTRWHSYSLKNDQAAVWRDDGIVIDSWAQPSIERDTLPPDASDLERLEHLKRLAADREALHLHEPAGMFVDAEEVTKLFALLMQGQVDYREGL
jgi:hypothetical protein